MFLKRSKVLINRKPNNKAANISQTDNPLKGDRNTDGDTINSLRSDHTSSSKDFSHDHKTGSYEAGKSFRRGLRDGTINGKFISKESNINISHKHTKNLSFTDSIAEDESSTVKIRKSKMSKIMAKRKKKGIHMVVDSSEPLTQTANVDQAHNSPPEINNVTDISERSYDAHSPIDSHSNDENNQPETFPDTVRNSYDENMVEMAMEEKKMDMEEELRNILANMHEEYEILKGSIEEHKKLIMQNNKKLAKIISDIGAVEHELEKFSNILALTRSLAGLVHEKEADLEKHTKDMLAYRNERMEETYRLRRWLYCDFLRKAGYDNVDYKCGDLEEVDDYGQDRFKGIKNSFKERAEALKMSDKLYGTCLERAKDLVYTLRGKSLKDYLSRDVINCFIPDFGFDYDLGELITVYNSPMSNEDLPKVLDDVEFDYCCQEAVMEPFFKFEKEHPNEFKEFEMGNNLRRVFRFYAIHSLAELSLLGDHPDFPELSEYGWLRFTSSYSPELVPEILYEVVSPVAIASIDHWDIESYDHSYRLSNLLSFVLQNIHPQNRSSIAEKVTNTLIKVIESRLSVCCIKLRAENVKDQKILNLIKYQLINISSNLVLLSSFLSPVTLAKFVLDKIFVSNLLPLLRFDSPFDAFAVLQFKASISSGLGKHLEVKTKTNSMVKSAFNRFKEHSWDYKVSCKIFKTLEIPINVTTYIEALNS